VSCFFWASRPLLLLSCYLLSFKDVCVFFYFNNNSYPALLTMVKESLVTRVSSAAVAEASNALGFLKMLHGWGPLEQVEVRLR